MTVVVVGDVMDDVLVRPKAPRSSGSDTDSEIRRSPGGSGANQAAWLASLGVPVRFYGRAGASDRVRHEEALGDAGVEAHIAGDPTEPTGTIVVLVVAGDRDMFTDRGANRRLERADLPPDLRDVAHLHVSGYPLFEAATREHVSGLMREAAAAGVPFSVDPSSESYLRATKPEVFLRITQGAAAVFPNAAEARLLAGRQDEASAARALNEHYPLVVVKLGAAGALLSARGSTPVRVAAEPVEVLDTTGAGDAFCAGFLAARFQGVDDAEATRAAVATASRALRHLGGRPPGP